MVGCRIATLLPSKRLIKNVTCWSEEGTMSIVAEPLRIVDGL